MNISWIRWALAGVLAVSAGCGEESKVRLGEESAEAEVGESSSSEEAKEMDQFVEEELASNTHAEAREWCDPKHENHMGFEVSTSEMLRLANEMYDAGAVKVYVTGIDEFAKKQISASMAMELPTEAQSRKRVFAWEKKFAEEIGEEPTRDVGQKYYFLALD